MAMNYSDYPGNWEDIRARVLERAKNPDGISQCECLGECGREHKGTRCLHLQYGRLTTRSNYKVILTTAHLCHTPKCDRLDHLKSMCQPCHQIFDLRERQKRDGSETNAGKAHAARLSKLTKPKTPFTREETGTPESGVPSASAIPTGEMLLLPVLKILADGLERSSQEIRECLSIQTEIAPNARVQKLANGKTKFDSNIDLALAYLQGARGVGTKAIEKSEKRMYKITKVGKGILNSSFSDLTIKILRSWRLP